MKRHGSNTILLASPLSQNLDLTSQALVGHSSQVLVWGLVSHILIISSILPSKATKY